jgi:amidophosphoribosyltransferase
VVDDLSVYDARIAMGEQLAREHPGRADVVDPRARLGRRLGARLRQASGLPFEMGLIRNHYVGRTFIEPKDSIRHFGVKLKLNPVPQVLKGRRVVVVDDSLVRGTTSRKIVKMIRAAGATEVHLRISSPPVISPCYYGIDTPTRSRAGLASTHNPEEIARYVTADTSATSRPRVSCRPSAEILV